MEITRRDFMQKVGAGFLVLASNPRLPLPSIGKKAVTEQNLTFYFPETGHNLEEPFLTFWRTNGGRINFGDPITEVNNNNIPIQYFQKARMELYPNNQIMLGLLGSELYDVNSLPPLEDQPRHPKFARFYETRGGIEIFGNGIHLRVKHPAFLTSASVYKYAFLKNKSSIDKL